MNGNKIEVSFHRMCGHIETKVLALFIESVSPSENGGSNDFIKRFERFGQKVRTSTKTYPLMGWIRTIDGMGKMSNNKFIKT